jgi:SAM-dependent methyltransferase
MDQPVLKSELASRQNSLIRTYVIALKRVAIAFIALTLIFGIIHFPYNTDAPLTVMEIESAQKYYADSYRKPAPSQAQTDFETHYVDVATAAAKTFRIEDQIRGFAERFNLTGKPVLEIGSGRGYLQDVVKDYTGLDISPSAARFYHKKFVIGSATAIPFADDSFNGVWSIWVFEHVPNPEQAFSEARRVTKNGGLLFFLPAWMAASWAGEGYQVRPYSDFDLKGKIIKASIPLRSSGPFQALALMPIRALRSVVALFGPTRLRYRRLTPNYEKYWVQDSDAVNSIDSHEAMLWFQSRGDECLNCDGAALLMGFGPLVIRVNK